MPRHSSRSPILRSNIRCRSLVGSDGQEATRQALAERDASAHLRVRHVRLALQERHLRVLEGRGCEGRIGVAGKSSSVALAHQADAENGTFSTWLTDQGIPWPPNLWAGTSITNERSTIRIPSLLQVGDSETIRFVSVEPQVEPIDLRPWLSGLDWVIQGGESGSSSRLSISTGSPTLSTSAVLPGCPCSSNNLAVPSYLRGSERSFQDAHAGDWSEWPEEIRVRQMPQVTSATTRNRGFIREQRVTGLFELCILTRR